MPPQVESKVMHRLDTGGYLQDMTKRKKKQARLTTFYVRESDANRERTKRKMEKLRKRADKLDLSAV